jgi:hypothetical protein
MSTQTFETSFRGFHHNFIDTTVVGSMWWCKVPVDFGMFTGYGVKHTDVTNPVLEFLIFGDKGLPVI